MGGMQSLALAYLAPERVGRVASISATGRSGLGGVGMRFAQRSGASRLVDAGECERTKALMVGEAPNSAHGRPQLE